MPTYDPGSRLTLDIEKPAVGGRMLARIDGRVVLVWGAVPGERVVAQVERRAKGVIYAETVDVVTASPDRRPARGDWRCGGQVFAHLRYPRQLEIKSAIVRDAFARIARLPLHTAPAVIGSPEEGYRMRARLHVQAGRLGFLREGTHQLCDAAAAGPLSPGTRTWIGDAQRTIARRGLSGATGVQIAENVAGDERACHLDLRGGTDPATFAALGDGLVGLSAQRADGPSVACLAGTPVVTDTVHPLAGSAAPSVRLRRDVRAFFQGNRFLLEPLVQQVIALVPAGPVIDLYAGVGLFGLSLAASGLHSVTLVEGDPVSGLDLQANALVFGEAAKVEGRSVEVFLGDESTHGRQPAGDATIVADPPRTGMSKDALRGVVRLHPRRIVYVSCDVATLARDARTLVDGGYELDSLTGMDLFPNTAHVETIAVFVR